MAMRRVRVIGCGSPDGADDAAGLLAARAAARRLAGVPGMEVVEAGPAIRVLDLLAGVDAVVAVDAVRTRGGARPPGRLVRVDGDADVLGRALPGTASSHGVGLADVVRLGAALGLAPKVVFVGVEAGRVGAGAGLSAEVRRALPALVSMVEAEALSLSEEVRR